MKTLAFNNGEDSIELSGNEPKSVSYTMVIEEADDSFIVEIPSFKIFFETDSEEDIAALAKKSFESFFKFWLHQNGVDAFKKHIIGLGFKQKRSLKKSEGKTISRQSLVFCG